jgi:propane monooxygenase coupling protein
MTAVEKEKFGATNRTSSNACGVTLMNNQNGYVVADVMRHHDGVQVREYPSMIRIDGGNKIEFDFDEISEALGAEFNVYDFEEIMSTHYGRMVHLDDKTVLFANPEDAAEYIDFDLKVVDAAD